MYRWSSGWAALLNIAAWPIVAAWFFICGRNYFIRCWVLLMMSVLWSLAVWKGPTALKPTHLLMALGALLNFLALVSNTGRMPVKGLGRSEGVHVPFTEHSHLPWLTDVILGFSSGDVLLFAGVCYLIFRLPGAWFTRIREP